MRKNTKLNRLLNMTEAELQMYKRMLHPNSQRKRTITQGMRLSDHPVSQQLLEEIIANRAPSVTPKDLKAFERIREEFMPTNKARKLRAIGYVK